MSELRLNILDVSQAVHGTIHGSEADLTVAALSAEPETIEELRNAVARFIKPAGDCQLFAQFNHGVNNEPWDTGIMFVDLAARIVAMESSNSMPPTVGRVQYHDGVHAADVWLPYCVPDDWLFVASVAEYESVCGRRRTEIAMSPSFDARPILYGAIADFIVRKCLAARDSNIKDPIADIHAEWLMTPRDDLRGLSPREVLLKKQDFIDADLHSREVQWSFLGEPAPCLKQDSAAYRFAGFGTHEIVMYYDLCRLLLSKCWKRVCKRRKTVIADEVARLEKIKAKWTISPLPDFSGTNPAYILECERKRLPLLLSAEEALIDEDCPLCQAMAHEPIPGFWHLDGSNMDDAFPFSLYRTHDEWEEEERCRREFEAEFDLEWEQRKTKLFDDSGLPADNKPSIH